MTQAPPESALPKGFRFAATACGLKKTGALDLALISSDVPASAAAVFTQNLVVAAPVTLSKKNLRESKGRMRAVVVNAGNANCATGEQGELVSLRTNEEAARRMAMTPHELFVCSTGVIGVQLPVEKVLRALPTLARNRRASARSFTELSLAICTTDTRPKTASASFKMSGKRVHVLGCAKGAGMIHPNMATTLAFVVTDASISPALLQKTLANDPNEPDTHVKLASVLLKKGNAADALQHANRAIELDGHLAAAHATKGLVLWLSGRRPEAIAAFDQGPGEFCRARAGGSHVRQFPALVISHE